jgi:hypothetical protein
MIPAPRVSTAMRFIFATMLLSTATATADVAVPAAPAVADADERFRLRVAAYARSNGHYVDQWGGLATSSGLARYAVLCPGRDDAVGLVVVEDVRERDFRAYLGGGRRPQCPTRDHTNAVWDKPPAGARPFAAHRRGLAIDWSSRGALVLQILALRGDEVVFVYEEWEEPYDWDALVKRGKGSYPKTSFARFDLDRIH